MSMYVKNELGMPCWQSCFIYLYCLSEDIPGCFTKVVSFIVTSLLYINQRNLSEKQLGLEASLGWSPHSSYATEGFPISIVDLSRLLCSLSNLFWLRAIWLYHYCQIKPYRSLFLIISIILYFKSCKLVYN